MRTPIPFGKYYLLERINIGGMAEVFRAKAYGVEGFERLVAVKRILPNIAEDKDFIRMFIDEAKIAVQLNHANIAQIFDLGVDDSDYYIALEHIHGRDLRAIFDRCRQRDGRSEMGDPMPIAQACFVIMKVCEGLDYAHNKRDPTGRELNLVHRDVSPQNVLVSFEGEVKLIDFGIAKAAGKGSKTQAGILKGKFGYMSPEQVRGLPIDRRSDVFSCGIVLYELLTGERLFVGESDFSTLEKVRNVEILPPTTYNRRIPDELERIVLKALAKDSDERYQSAIDLHDELQAFVYTAGEFYSRKDLAGWMKATFAAEIEEETAKLESFRHVNPPDAGAVPASPPTRARTIPPVPAAPGRRATLSMPAAPPPTPATREGAPRRHGTQPLGTNAAALAAARLPEVGAHEPAEWDDDSETAIYSDATELPMGRAAESGAVRAVAAPDAVASARASGPVLTPPDESVSLRPGPGRESSALADLSRTSRAWPPAAELPQRPRNGGHLGSAFADGSGSPVPDVPMRETTLVDRHPAFAPELDGDPLGLAAPAVPSRRLRAQPAPPTFGTSFLDAHGHGRSRRWPKLSRLLRDRLDFDLRRSTAAQVVVTAAIGVAIAVLVYVVTSPKGGRGKARAPRGETPATATAPHGTAPAAPAARPGGQAPVSVDPASGFDLIVDPAGVVVKLDGRPIGKAPLQIRNLVEGTHLVAIDPPPGFYSKAQAVEVVRGAAHRVVIRLDAMEIIGRFSSDPPGARVTLVVDGEKRTLGATPVAAVLDPRKRYEAVFRRDGYQPVTQPIAMSGAAELQVAAVLEPAGRPAPMPVAARRAPRPEAVEQPDGALGIMAKPPCRIFIDGRDTGQKTPQVGIKLRPGRHRITLVNDEFSIEENFVVEIQPGETMKMMKDLTGRLPGGAAAAAPEASSPTAESPPVASPSAQETPP